MVDPGLLTFGRGSAGQGFASGALSLMDKT